MNLDNGNYSSIFVTKMAQTYDRMHANRGNFNNVESNKLFVPISMREKK